MERLGSEGTHTASSDSSYIADMCIDGCSLFDLPRCLCYPRNGCITMPQYPFELGKF
jgi:hypothetical protein